MSHTVPGEMSIFASNYFESVLETLSGCYKYSLMQDTCISAAKNSSLQIQYIPLFTKCLLKTTAVKLLSIFENLKQHISEVG